MEEYEEDFTLKDVDIKSKKFFDKLDKKKLAYISIISLIVIAIIIIIIIVALSSSEDKNEEEEEKNKISPKGEIICEYDVKSTEINTIILGQNFTKPTDFEIEINGEIINYNKEHKFNSFGKNIVIFKLNNEDINMNYMFKDISSLISVNMTSEKDVKINSMISSFDNCENLKNFNIEGYNISDVKSMHKLFYKTAIRDINLTKIITENVEDISYMFGETEISEIDFSNINLSSVINMSHIFDSCSSLREINLSPSNTNNLKDISYMFHSCLSLKELNLEKFETSNVIDMSHLFGNCIFLTSLNLKDFKTENVMDMSYVIYV